MTYSLQHRRNVRYSYCNLPTSAKTASLYSDINIMRTVISLQHKLILPKTEEDNLLVPWKLGEFIEKMRNY